MGRGKSIWVDETDIPPASKWADDLKRAIESSDSFMYLISRGSVASAECRKELEHAISLNKRILPVLVEPVDLELLPEAVRVLQFIPPRGSFEDDFSRSFELLVAAIDTDLD
jgi:hypothetical protein